MPDDGRVLILPGAERNRYRWGYIGDDIFDATLTQPHLLRQSFTQGLPETGSLLTALDERTVNDKYEPGSFAPLARLLGVRWVLIRNDLDWQTMESARPSDLDGLRRDPALRRIATFGRPGEDTTAADDLTVGVLGETTLPPVELYAVDGSTGVVQLRPSGPPTLVSGDGEALVSLGAAGVLDGSPGFRFSATTSQQDLQSLLAAGAPVVISDSNRRRATQVTSNHNFNSYTLPAGADLDRPALDVYGVAGSQTVATYGDATAITASGFGSSLARYENWFRPSNAFDHDPSTAWRTAGASDPVGQWLRVDLRQPTTLSTMTLTPSPVAAKRRITAVTISFSDGTSTNATINATGDTVVDFTPRTATWFRVRIDQVAGTGVAALGFAEVDVPGVDLTETLQVPDDIFRAAASSSELASQLATADVRYSFDRLLRLGTQDEEIDVRRRFETTGTRSFDFQGTLRVDDSTSDAVLDRLAGGSVGAVGSARYGPVATARAGLAVDGRLDTAWQAPAAEGATLTTRFPSQEISAVDVLVASQASTGPGFSDITQLEVSAGDGPPVPCAPAPLTTERAIGCHVAVDPAVADHVVITITGIRPRSSPLGDQPVGIAEVSVLGADGANITGTPSTTLDGECRQVATVDGAPVLARTSGSIDDLVNGTPIAITGCGSTKLAPGWHDLASSPEFAGALGHVELRAGARASAPVAADGTITIAHQTPAGADIRVDSATGGTLVLGQSYAPGWQAKIDGHTVPASSLDTMGAWAVPAGTTDVAVGYAPQRFYELGLAAMAGTAALCLVLIVRRGREPAMALALPEATSTPVRDVAPGQLSNRSEVMLAIGLGVAGFLFANLEGAVLAVGAVVAARRGGLKLIGKAAALAVALAGLATLSVTLTDDPEGVAAFVSRRSFASVFGQLAAVLVVVYVVMAAVTERASTAPVATPRAAGGASGGAAWLAPAAGARGRRRNRRHVRRRDRRHSQ